MRVATTRCQHAIMAAENCQLENGFSQEQPTKTLKVVSMIFVIWDGEM